MAGFESWVVLAWPKVLATFATRLIKSVLQVEPIMTTNKRITAAIMLALVIWGIYLAVGSTGYFTDASLMDSRKSVIVATCMTSFLAMWVFVLRAVEKRKSNLQGPSKAGITEPALGRAWSRAGLVTLGIGGLGLLLWGIAVTTFGNVGLVVTTVMGWLAAVSMVGAATSGMIALSNPRAARGKWLGFMGLLLCAMSFIGFVVRMTP